MCKVQKHTKVSRLLKSGLCAVVLGFTEHQHNTGHIVLEIHVSISLMENKISYETCWYSCEILVPFSSLLWHKNGILPCCHSIKSRDYRVPILTQGQNRGDHRHQQLLCYSQKSVTQDLGGWEKQEIQPGLAQHSLDCLLPGMAVIGDRRTSPVLSKFNLRDTFCSNEFCK